LVIFKILKNILNIQISGFYVIHHSNFPDSAFIINANKPDSRPSSETGSAERPTTTRSPAAPRATADKGFELQLDKFQSAGLTGFCYVTN